jgi:putative salt-induced outer membrane protein YdiY
MRRFMKRGIAIIGILSAAIFLGAGYVDAADPPVMDSGYIKEHYPDVYLQIFREGKEAGKKEAETAVKNTDVPVQAAPAATGPALPATIPASAPQTKPDLGSWWEHSSLKYSPLPEQWLFHVEGTLDYKHRTGNTQSDRYDGSASLMARKRRFTNTFIYMISKEFSAELSQTGSRVNKTDSDYRSVQDALRYDLTDRFYAEGGYMWEKDTANYIAGRNSYYAGVGYALIDAKRHNLGVFFAGGYENEKYPEVIKTAMNLDYLEVGAAYFREDYRWNITDRLTYKQTFRIIQNLKSTDVFNNDVAHLRVIGETNRYRWFLINEIYFKLADHLNFMIGYKVEYDSNPWPTVEKMDTTLKSGIQFSY